MSELVFKSAGVSVREIDISGRAASVPIGTPACVIGTAQRGPAFVPVTLGTFGDFKAIFGDTDGEKFGPLAVREWLRNAGSLTYVRVLGVGDGTQRTSSGDNTGKVTRAGFVVGSEQPLDSGLLGGNPKAVAAGVLGRTHFLGCYMSESAGSTVFSSAGLQVSGENVAHPILRGVVLAASGVVPLLSSSTGATSVAPSNSVSATAGGPQGAITGTMDLASGKQEFVMLLNGHIGTSQYPNVITASFDVEAGNYISKVLNTDPLKVQDAGHLLYTHYGVHPALATITSSGVILPTLAEQASDTAFMTTSSLGRNAGSTTIPNFESYEDRFKAAFSPFVISQKFGGSPKNLFKLHALSDGDDSAKKFKISIRNIAKSRSERDKYGSFDVLVRDFYDVDSDPVIIEKFTNLSLDPSSERYIARIVGDMNVYFDFDQAEGRQRLVFDGNYANASQYVRVEMADGVTNGTVDQTALPIGFRGPHHLATSGSSIMTPDASTGVWAGGVTDVLQNMVEPPVPLRENITKNLDPKKTVSSDLYWGVQFERKNSATELNQTSVFEDSIESYTKYFPNFHTSWLNPWVGDNAGVADVAGTVLDSDRFNNNQFTLENLLVRTGSTGVADPKYWLSASYVRQGGIAPVPADKTRAFSVTTDLDDPTARRHAKFTFFVQGGFDGLNIFDSETTDMTNAAIIEEMSDTNRGVNEGATVSAYLKALDIVSEETDVDIQLLAIPGIRDAVVADKALQTVEDRFDALYIMDIPEYDELNTVLTSSLSQVVSVTNTVTAFDGRGVDSSFAAAYFPDAIVQDPATLTNVQVPPSVVTLGAFSLNDALGHPWFAPAGFTRGALRTALDVTVGLTRTDLDTLSDSRINPLVTFQGTEGPVVWGQKTLQTIQSSLDRVNVRRLLIEIRRRVRRISRRFVFEPNRATTLAKFESQVRPELKRIQELNGVDRFKVKIDTSTTTQADVENNTIRGKIFIQPTRTAEFISLDFVVSNDLVNVS